MKHLSSIIVTILLVMTVLSVTAIYLLVKHQERLAAVSDFEGCAAYQGVIQASYPPVCRLPDGRSFVQDVPPVRFPSSR